VTMLSELQFKAMPSTMSNVETDTRH